ADAAGAVRELNENNNVAATAALTLTLPALPDLGVTQATAPSSGVPGQHVTVAWTVQNAGEVTARSTWTDRVYLSSNGSVTGANFLGALAHSLPLDPGAHYDAALDVTLPDRADGAYQFIVVTDADGTLFEGAREANNTFV